MSITEYHANVIFRLRRSNRVFLQLQFEAFYTVNLLNQFYVLCVLILMSGIDKDISESKVVSFADDTRIYHQINNDDHTNQLQTNLNKMYNWSVTNNMLFNASKFQSICYSSHASVDSNFIYKDYEDNQIAWFDHVKYLGIYMSQNLTFVEQIKTVYNKCSQLMGWILRTFISRERTVMLLLFKSLVLSRVT